MLVIDFVYWFAFAMFQTTFALFAARRFQFDASQTGYFFSAFGILGAIVQGGFIRPVVRRLGDKPTFIVGLVCSAVGLVAATLTHSVGAFALTLVPLALGDRIRPSDGFKPRQPRGARGGAGPGSGRGECGREPWPDDRPGMGQRLAPAIR